VFFAGRPVRSAGLDVVWGNFVVLFGKTLEDRGELLRHDVGPIDCFIDVANPVS